MCEWAFDVNYIYIFFFFVFYMYTMAFHVWEKISWQNGKVSIIEKPSSATVSNDADTGKFC